MSRAKSQAGSTADRLPPYAPEAEQAALSCILGGNPESAASCLNTCEERGVSEAWFYDLRHQVIWWAMADIHKRGLLVESTIVYQWLLDSQRAADAGGLDYLMETANKLGIPSMLPQFLDTLEEKWLQRRIIQTATGATASVYEGTIPTTQIIAQVEKEVLALSEDRSGERERPIKELVVERIDELEHYHRGQVQMRGMFTTGLDYTDKLLGGIGGRNGNFFVIAGRPGTGKTTLALQVAAHVAIEAVWWEPEMGADGKLAIAEDGSPKFVRHETAPVGIFSLEMASESLVERMMFMRGGADMQRWRTGFAEKADLAGLVKASSELGKSAMWIDDTGAYVLDQLRARARRMARQYGVKLFVIDYIQLMDAGRTGKPDRVQELMEISKGIRRLAKELKVPFIVLAQMNRDYEKEPNRDPRLADLKDCGAIEQDADVVGFLHTPRLKDETKAETEDMLTQVYGEDWSKHPQRVNLLVAKNRFGPTGKAEMLFQKSSTRFYCWNAWKVEHGFRQASAGERQPVLPSKEELGVE